MVPRQRLTVAKNGAVTITVPRVIVGLAVVLALLASGWALTLAISGLTEPSASELRTLGEERRCEQAGGRLVSVPDGAHDAGAQGDADERLECVLPPDR